MESTRLPTRVISASKRTDIPAFYLPWFLASLRAGYVDVRNPVYRAQPASRVSLAADDVAAVVFWSKNYGVFRRFHEPVDDHFGRERLFFQFTINAPSALLEPDVPTTAQALEQVAFLATTYGAERISWRYDPIVQWTMHGTLCSNYDPVFFAEMCRQMAEFGVSRCFSSFADHYAKFRRRVSRHVPGMALVDPPAGEKQRMGTELAAIAGAHGIALSSCAEPALEDVAGIAKGACIDGALLSRVLGHPITRARSTEQRSPGREACGCTHAVDIGDYEAQECGYACLYCYANPNHRRFLQQS
jgi:hypothetical protein